MARLTVRLPTALKQAVIDTSIEQGYKKKGKSRWVREAIREYLTMDPGLERLIVDITDDKKFEPEIYTLDESSNLRLREGLVTLRKQYPHIEGGKAVIVRTAIVSKLGIQNDAAAEEDQPTSPPPHSGRKRLNRKEMTYIR